MSACLYIFTQRVISNASIEDLEKMAIEHERLIEEYNDRPEGETDMFLAQRNAGLEINLPKLYKELYLRFKTRCSKESEK